MQQHSTPVEYEDEKISEAEDIVKKEGRPPSFKQPSQKAKKKSSLQQSKRFFHKPPGRKPNILYVN